MFEFNSGWKLTRIKSFRPPEVTLTVKFIKTLSSSNELEKSSGVTIDSELRMLPSPALAMENLLILLSIRSLLRKLCLVKGFPLGKIYGEDSLLLR